MTLKRGNTMKSKPSRHVSVVVGTVLLVSVPAIANAVGYKYWNTYPGVGGYDSADSSQDGCTARGVGNSRVGVQQASTYWIDDVATYPYYCATVGVKAWVPAGGQSYWTAWDYDIDNAVVSGVAFSQAKHLLFTE
jgi:hypothetical protein